jgi:hypothetical protein
MGGKTNAVETARETGMQRPTFEDCIAGAWRDGCNLVRERPLFIVLSIAALYFVRVAVDELRVHHTPHSLSFLLAPVALWVIKVLLLNIVAVQAVRHVLLGNQAHDRRGFAGRDFWRYCGVTYGLLVSLFLLALAFVALVGLASHWLGLRGHERALYATTTCAALIAAIWVHARFSLLPSHAAIGRPLRWRAAWRDTRGHSFAIVCTNLGIAVTVCVCAALVGGLGALIAFAFHDGRNGPVMELVVTMASALGLVVCAAGWGWVYRRYAVALLEESPGSVSA